MLTVAESGSEAATARPIEVAAKPIEVVAKPALAAGSGEWFVSTPEGYFDCSANAARFIKWNVNGTLVPAERYLRRFRRPDLVQKALRGEKLDAPAITNDDLPPTARFVGLKEGEPISGASQDVTVEVRGHRDVKEVELLVNGRPLPPESARPIEVVAKPIEVVAKEGDPSDRFDKRFTFHVPLPGEKMIHLYAVAYDVSNIGSDPVEIVLKHGDAKSVTGNLYVLSVGVSRYLHAQEQGFKNLRFPESDAQAISKRFSLEGKPLFDRVQVRDVSNEKATLANIRAGLKWLQESVALGQVDTVVIYLSGHGYSTPDGHYYFAPYDFDLTHVAQTGLSGSELREALGGRLRAKAVFLFVDTCHSGGLSGRSEDLQTAIGEGVFILASSGATEYSYESQSWQHRAFTLALLRSLGKKELEDQGAIRFIDLAASVRREVENLMRAANQNEGEEKPCIPLAGRSPDEPVASAK